MAGRKGKEGVADCFALDKKNKAETLASCFAPLLRVRAIINSTVAGDKEDLIRGLAKQAYRQHLLIKALRAGGHLRPEEPDSLWNADEFKSFLQVFRLNYSKDLPKAGESGES